MIAPTHQSQIINARREWVFLLIAGIFLGSLTMLNILGISHFIDLSKYIGIPDSSSFRMVVAVGVLPYPITFLCTDIISEIYGKQRANRVVWVGLFLNVWVIVIVWLGGVLNPPAELIDGRLPLIISDGIAQAPRSYAFFEMRYLTFVATFASMFAYLITQFVDVQVFHFIKQKTKGKKLWLRNNVSTITSQLIDSIAVILITHFYTNSLPNTDNGNLVNILLMYILSSYLFKLIFALIDTVPFYFIVKKLRVYLDVKDEIGLGV